MSETKETHVHVLEDGTILEHSHGEHGHHHSHAQTKAVLNRLSRAIGHLESIKRMVEDGRDCSEVLIQLSAVKSAINNTGKIILQDHIESNFHFHQTQQNYYYLFHLYLHLSHIQIVYKNPKLLQT